MPEVWTTTSVLSWTSGYLARHGDEHPRLSAEWLLSAVTGLSRVELYTNYDRPLGADELAGMHRAVARRAAGEPLQYVTGEMPFRHIVLRCEPGVLIPRPETEVLVDAALEGLGSRAGEGEGTAPDGTGTWRRVLEVGTGTGCIACSLACERPETVVVATDISPAAVTLARRNAEALGVSARVEVVGCDLADGVPQALMGSFALLVSNPPYIPSAVVPELPHEVAGFEPHVALDGGPDGLDVFRRLLALAPQALAPGGWLCVELFEDAVHAAADLVRAAGGWEAVEVREDLTRRPRVLVARRCRDHAGQPGGPSKPDQRG